MRRLFCTIRELIEQRFVGNSTFQEKRDLRWQGVSAFCFLRFIVPGILHPHLFQLYPGMISQDLPVLKTDIYIVPGMPSQPVQRSLTLIAKVIQSLANLNAVGQSLIMISALVLIIRS